MAGYGCVRTFAKRLGYADAERLLQATLGEEGEADKAFLPPAKKAPAKNGKAVVGSAK